LQLKELFAAWNDGKIEEAQRIYHRYLPLISTVMTITASPIPVKHAVGLIGQPAGAPRLPLVAPTEDEAAVIKAALEEAGLL
jgi:4-hydroxy-tetrahydrodipicolinate synthase